MRQTINPSFSHLLCAGAAAVGLALAGGAASAQSVSELTVTGHMGANDNIRSLSQAVTYADLDLTTRDGVEALKFRIKDTSRQLCEQLGESGSSTGPVPSCEDAANADAMKQVKMAVAMATPMPGTAVAYAAPSYATSTASADTYSADTSAVVPAGPSYTTSTVTNGPVADTPKNRARFGGPMSNAGRNTSPAGN